MSQQNCLELVLIHGLRLGIEHRGAPEGPLGDLLCQELGLKRSAFTQQLQDLRILKQALDARQKPPSYVYSVVLELPADVAARLIRAKKVEPYNPKQFAVPKLSQANLPTTRPVVVGAGPAGLMAAWTLAQAGLKPILLERGKAVEERTRDVTALYARGEVNTESNVCFGEGGAGTYSDGKLYTRVSDGKIRHVYETLVRFGAKNDILINARPHIGTDKLVKLLKNWRSELLELGAEIHFNTALKKINLDSSQQVQSVVTASGDEFDTHQVILATGHSAREIWHHLADLGAQLEARPFAVGFRIEHPQAMINELRYGKSYQQWDLPAADYKLTYSEQQGDTKRGIYSFCMCPGGVIVATSIKDDALCINGMSHASRSGKYANSAMVVTVNPNDFKRWGYQGLFAGVDFQEAMERRAYEMGGGKHVAPAAKVPDFLNNRATSQLAKTSFRRGVASAPIHELYPEEITTGLQHALHEFNKKMRGFGSEEGQLLGAEVRTASPIRVLRDDSLQAVGIKGLYPSGEGMGYAGGIASAALDGLNVALGLIDRIKAD